ncbi:SEC14-like protein 2 [Orchesella cincta]|uniref:SEC14-like protein 2 n=1 Tax=Orchesella cincta TaxID=48709 RepID=A0A1D2NI09_ORCCI|nr:SEC14-like protein 2 [Orchesella cincta]
MDHGKTCDNDYDQDQPNKGVIIARCVNVATTEEVNLIKELRSNVSDLDLSGDFDTDTFYLRWIRAREWQLNRAEEMLRKSIQWRKENDINCIRKWEPECASVPVDYPIEISGFDKIGCPVVIIAFCHWDVRKGVEAGHAQEMIRHIDQALEIFEITMKQRSTPDKPVTQISLIFDMYNLSFWQLASMKTIETILEVVRRYEANHPEILHKAYVVNASRIFNMLFNIVKPFLSPRTLDKVNIYSAQQSQWMPALMKDIEQDQLPKYFGGTAYTAIKAYQDQENSIKIRFGPQVPEHKFTTININPEEKVLLTFDVNVPNTKLVWDFRTDYYDIEFSVYKENLQNEPEVPYDRVSSQMLAIKGEINCKTPGQYIAEFNNTYSEIRRAKTLRYNFKVVEPNSKK